MICYEMDPLWATLATAISLVGMWFVPSWTTVRVQEYHQSIKVLLQFHSVLFI